MRHVALRPPHELLVYGVHDLTLDRHDDGLVLRVGYHGPLHNSPWHISRPLGCRRLPAMRPLTEDGLDAGDVPADFAHPGRVLELTARLLKAQVERRSEEHTSELQSLMRISYAVFCLKKKQKQTQ